MAFWNKKKIGTRKIEENRYPKEEKPHSYFKIWVKLHLNIFLGVPIFLIVSAIIFYIAMKIGGFLWYYTLPPSLLLSVIFCAYSYKLIKLMKRFYNVLPIAESTDKLFFIPSELIENKYCPKCRNKLNKSIVLDYGTDMVQNLYCKKCQYSQEVEIIK